MKKMREYLYRARRVESKEWSYGVPLQHCDGDWQMISGKVGAMIIDTIIPETIGQYTGLTDKNGVKIFEGDIVHAVYKSNYVGVKDTDFGNGVVEYHGNYYSGARWEINIIDEVVCRVFSASVECEVIGNIHDNPPELLK